MKEKTLLFCFEMETNTNFIKPIANKNPHRIEKELITLSYAEYQNDTLKPTEKQKCLINYYSEIRFGYYLHRFSI